MNKLINPWYDDYKSKQGNVGLGRAIAYYTSKGIPISIPINDTQKYDLVVEKDEKLYKVSVKTTRRKNKSNTYFVVLLKNCGGSSGKNKIRKFDKSSCDIIFIVTSDDTLYEIPSDKIEVRNELTLTNSWDQYQVTMSFGTSAPQETGDVEVG